MCVGGPHAPKCLQQSCGCLIRPTAKRKIHQKKNKNQNPNPRIQKSSPPPLSSLSLLEAATANIVTLSHWRILARGGGEVAGSAREVEWAPDKPLPLPPLADPRVWGQRSGGIRAGGEGAPNPALQSTPPADPCAWGTERRWDPHGSGRGYGSAPPIATISGSTHMAEWRQDLLGGRGRIPLAQAHHPARSPLHSHREWRSGSGSGSWNGDRVDGRSGNGERVDGT